MHLPMYRSLVGIGCRSINSLQQPLRSLSSQSSSPAADVSKGEEAAARPTWKRVKPVYVVPTWTPPPKKIVAAAVVERLPLITPDMRDWEEAMLDLQMRKLEAIGKRLPPEMEYKPHELHKTEADEYEAMTDEEIIATAYPRKTEADLKGDKRAAWRRLDRRVFLVIQRNKPADILQGETEWNFPQSLRQEGETMRDAVMRTMTTLVQDTAQLFPVGFCPMGYVDRGTGDDRSRVFYYKVQYIEGSLTPVKEIAKDHVWLLQEELKDYLDADLAKITEVICDQ
ncbi:hypothetical protein GUITHDRAFT_114545 [Guillardia theta CCMP2712]|uniref:Large ribosomal subunit protein mL46 n=1 Tax=Guillardia theta (strain CCMP2712) TaxID=905079 RepID=L1ISW6_GUITC|nr:hypothetical protein GUITHDRAFT_114545 [Guillardia theta CCMP2712]EKX39346.1 hypothetical protein GUITHDRAFT_114545 [Guillardia theta CCMP2712]|eukprot:XP_005826326.1 hypothetical protein GUITHDRAFT_114545 [Guillardia theta CCMP2712]